MGAIEFISADVEVETLDLVKHAVANRVGSLAALQWEAVEDQVWALYILVEIIDFPPEECHFLLDEAEF